MAFEAEIRQTVRDGYRPLDVAVLHYDGDLLIQIETASGEIHATFDAPVGFRVLDEGDLLEFWPDCNLRDGWLYQIRSGGWGELEATRDGFLSALQTDLGEWLIVTENTCVSVISHRDPAVRIAS